MRGTTSHTQTNNNSHMLPSLYDYVYLKNLRDQLIPFRDIYHQKILQSDWMRVTTDQTQQKVVISDAAFPYD